MKHYIVLKINNSGDMSNMKSSGTSNIKTNTLNNLNLVDYNDIPIDNHCVYLFIKHIDCISIDKLKELKEKNKKLIFEPIDYNYQNLNDLYNIIKYFDEIICVSYHFKKILSSLNNKLNYSVIYHEYDNKFQFNKRTDTIYYIGNLKRKCSLSKQNINDYSIKYISPKNKNFHNECYNGIHINYLKKNHYYYNNITSTKLSTALYLNSIFICNRVPIYLEILGDNYEYYLNDDLSNIKELIGKAKDTILDDNKYNNYINKYKIIKESLSPEKINIEYIKILNKYLI